MFLSMWPCLGETGHKCNCKFCVAHPHKVGTIDREVWDGLFLGFAWDAHQVLSSFPVHWADTEIFLEYESDPWPGQVETRGTGKSTTALEQDWQAASIAFTGFSLRTQLCLQTITSLPNNKHSLFLYFKTISKMSLLIVLPKTGEKKRS